MRSSLKAFREILFLKEVAINHKNIFRCKFEVF